MADRRLTRAQISVVGVDSGRLVVTDPTRIKSEWTPKIADQCWNLTPLPILAEHLNTGSVSFLAHSS